MSLQETTRRDSAYPSASSLNGEAGEANTDTVSSTPLRSVGWGPANWPNKGQVERRKQTELMDTGVLHIPRVLRGDSHRWVGLGLPQRLIRRAGRFLKE